MDIIYCYGVACYKKKCKIELIKKIYINRHKRITAGFLVVIFFISELLAKTWNSFLDILLIEAKSGKISKLFCLPFYMA